MSEVFEPRIVAFVCNWCTYLGADLAGTTRLEYPANVRIVRLPCSGRIDFNLLIKKLSKSAPTRYWSPGCHPGDCHYNTGNYHARRRWMLFRPLLEVMGFDMRRLHFAWISAAESRKFQQTVKQSRRGDPAAGVPTNIPCRPQRPLARGVNLKTATSIRNSARQCARARTARSERSRCRHRLRILRSGIRQTPGRCRPRHLRRYPPQSRNLSGEKRSPRYGTRRHFDEADGCGRIGRAGAGVADRERRRKDHPHRRAWPREFRRSRRVAGAAAGRAHGLVGRRIRALHPLLRLPPGLPHVLLRALCSRQKSPSNHRYLARADRQLRLARHPRLPPCRPLCGLWRL